MKIANKVKAAVLDLENAGKNECAASYAPGVRFGSGGHIADGSADSDNYIAAVAKLNESTAAFETALSEAGMLPSGATYGEGINWPKSWAGKLGMVVMSSGSSWPMIHFWSAANLKKSAQYRAMCARVDQEEAR